MIYYGVAVAVGTILLGVCCQLMFSGEEIPLGIVNPNSSYDYIIVGGGTAGLVVANRLSGDEEVTVLVIEAGKVESFNPLSYIPMNVAKTPFTDLDWDYKTIPQKHAYFGMKNNISFWPSGRGLGGSTLINYMVWARGSRYDYDSWAASGCTGWAFDDILKYFIKMENNISPYIDKEYHGNSGPIGISHIFDSGLSEAFLKAGEEMGYSIRDHNGHNGDNKAFSRMQGAICNGIRCDAVRNYLLPIINERQNLHVALRSHATKVNIENKVAKGVTFIQEGIKKYVSANKEIILSAGTIGSPQILLISGVGPEDHLTKMNIPVVADLPVGQNLQDHVAFTMRATIKEPWSYTKEKIESTLTWLQYKLFKSGHLAFNGGNEAIAFLKTDETTKDEAPDIELQLISALDMPIDWNYRTEIDDSVHKGRNGKLRDGLNIIIERLHPTSRGTVQLGSKDPFDYPMIDPNYLSSIDDVKGLIRGIRVVQKLMKTKAMVNIGTEYVPVDISECNQKYDSDEYWTCMIRHVATTLYHPTSTCKMGAQNDPSSVVDADLRVKGIKNPRVADASIMPSVVSSNPMAPTYMIGEKAADLIKSDNKI